MKATPNATRYAVYSSVRRGDAKRFSKRELSRAVAALFAIGGTSHAFAQTVETATPNTLSTVVVTGTLIRGTNPVGTPVIGVTRADIEKSGASTTVDLLRELPQIQNLGADEGHTNTAQNANQNVTVGSGINLRGLGPESTLTLLDGRRVAPGGVAGQYTDPSSIPPLAIEKLEVITDGASATYGSDAVGGVVNIRLRKHFDGAEASARYGTGKDIRQTQFGAILGKTWDGGDVMIAVDHNKRTALSADHRRFYTDDLRPWGGPDLRSTLSNPGNVTVAGVRYAIPAGQNGVGLSPSRLVAGTSNLQSIYKGVSALPEQKRNSVVFSLSQAVTEKVNVWAEGFWTKRDFLRQLAAFSNAALTVRNTNPYFVSPTGTASETVSYSFFNDLGTAPSSGFEKSRQISAGVDIELPGDWNASAYASNSVTQERNLAPALNVNAVNAALADTNPATSLNLFCDGRVFVCNNPATTNLFRAYNDRNSKYTLNDYGAKADGPVFSLPAGMLRIAVGAEYHDDKLPYFLIRNDTTANTSLTTQIDNFSALPKRNVKSLYSEAYIPLVGPANAVTGVQKLDLSLAGRAERYSDFGSTRNPKVGLSWTPIKGFDLHGTYGRSFRAPTLGDTDEINGSATNVVDRTDADGRTSVHGIQLLGGNSNGLKPETAKIYTFGASFKPAMLPGFNATLDYFNIDYNNRILTPGNDPTILQRPELAAYVNRNPTAAEVMAAIARPTFSGNPAEPVAGIKFIADGRRYNAGVVKTSGVDLLANYFWDTGWGRWNTGLFGNYIFNYKQQFTPTTPLVSGLVNTLNNPMRFRARGELGWTSGAWRVNSFVYYTNRYHNTTLASNPNVASYTTVDLTARYDLGNGSSSQFLKGTAVVLSVQNIGDRNPPYVQNGTLAFDPQNVSAIGRFVSLSVNKSF